MRAFTFGHVRQLDAVAARFLLALARRQEPTASAPSSSSGGYAFVDVDDTVIEVHGHAKQGAGFGYSRVHGLNALPATVTTAHAAPLVVAALWLGGDHPLVALGRFFAGQAAVSFGGAYAALSYVAQHAVEVLGVLRRLDLHVGELLEDDQGLLEGFLLMGPRRSVRDQQDVLHSSDTTRPRPPPLSDSVTSQEPLVLLRRRGSLLVRRC